MKIAATHAGVTVGDDGGSHQSIEDIALMRVIPGMTVLNPADAAEAEKLIYAAAAHVGPVYIRLGREPMPIVFDDSYQPEIGKAVRLREGDAAAIIATGIMVERALLAADRPLTSHEILAYAYPRWTKRWEYWHFDNIRRAAAKYATLVGRKGHQPIWALKERHGSEAAPDR